MFVDWLRDDFPTSSEADFANKNKMWDQQSWEGFARNKEAIAYTDSHGRPVRPQGDKFTAPVSPVDLLDPKNRGVEQQLHNVFARAALAVQRDPIATLGFQPRVVGADVVSNYLQSRQQGFVGEFDPNTGWIYANNAQHDIAQTITHESIHRGLHKLAAMRPQAFSQAIAGWINPATGAEGTTQAFLSSEENELLVQRIVATVMGAGSHENEDYQAKAYDKYDKDPGRFQRLQRLQDLAADEIARERPGGPR
jgi:hypothetical protein